MKTPDDPGDGPRVLMGGAQVLSVLSQAATVTLPESPALNKPGPTVVPVISELYKVRGAGYACPPVSCLRFTDVRSLWPLRSAYYFKRYTLTLIESPESILIDGCMVYKYILAIICRDKTKTFLLVKPFYCSLCH